MVGIIALLEDRLAQTVPNSSHCHRRSTYSRLVEFLVFQYVFVKMFFIRLISNIIENLCFVFLFHYNYKYFYKAWMA